MISNLSDILVPEGALKTVGADARALVDQELSEKSGISAAAVKVAYKAVTAFAPGYYTSIVEQLVPPMLEALQPYWADFQAAGGGSFGDYLVKRGDEVTESLLGVTDDFARDSEKAVVVKAYQTVRGGAGKHIQAALPNLGALVEKYAA